MHRRLIVLTAALTLMSFACKKPAPERVEAAPETTAPAETTAPQELMSTAVSWDDVRAAVKDPKVDAIKRVELIDSFIADNPDDPQLKRASALRKKYTRQAERLQRELDKNKDAEKYADERAADAAKMLEGDLARLVAPLIYQTHGYTYSDRKKPTPKGFTNVDISLPTYPTVSYDKPRYLGLGTLRNSASTLVEERLPKLDAPDGCTYDECQRLEINALFSKRLGGELLPAPARLAPDKIATLLGELASIKPDTPILGVKASDLYAANSLSISHYLRVYAVLNKMGEKKVRAAYNKALAANPKKMISFYIDFSRENAITSSAGLDMSLADAPYVPVGFWMRRIADGSAASVFGPSMKLLQRFDPAEHRRVSRLMK